MLAVRGPDRERDGTVGRSTALSSARSWRLDHRPIIRCTALAGAVGSMPMRFMATILRDAIRRRPFAATGVGASAGPAGAPPGVDAPLLPPVPSLPVDAARAFAAAFILATARENAAFPAIAGAGLCLPDCGVPVHQEVPSMLEDRRSACNGGEAGGMLLALSVESLCILPGMNCAVLSIEEEGVRRSKEPAGVRCAEEDSAGPTTGLEGAGPVRWPTTWGEDTAAPGRCGSSGFEGRPASSG